MNSIPSQPSGIRQLLASKRRLVKTDEHGLLKTSLLPSGQTIPVLVEPAVPGVNLAEYCDRNPAEIAVLLLEHRALLFRGFQINSAAALAQLVGVTSAGPLLDYQDRTTPRENRGQRIYTSTTYPAHQPIRLHNEGTYWLTWPRKIYFACVRAPASGGETPLADVRKVLQRIAAEVREQFTARGVCYLRNYNDGFGLPWQEVFQTKSKADVEQYCRSAGIEFTWKANDRLRTRQVRPAVRVHPQTGESVWFNHAAFFHISGHDPAMRETLQSSFREDDLPYNTYFGDGAAIEDQIAADIQQAYRAEKVSFPWHEGDLLLLDNMTIAHGREPFCGQREVLTAMAEPCSATEG